MPIARGMTVVDPGSEKRGVPGVLGACPQDCFVNISQFRGLFEVFSENKGGASPPLWIRHCMTITGAGLHTRGCTWVLKNMDSSYNTFYPFFSFTIYFL